MMGLEKPLPRHARVVVIGGGIVGASTAYHLAKLGVRDVVVVRRLNSPVVLPGMRRAWLDNCVPVPTSLNC